MKPSRSFPARYPGRCERCRGRVIVGQQITTCAGVYGTYEHVTASDCRQAFRVLQREQLAADVRHGFVTADAAERILARDDAAVKYPDPAGDLGACDLRR